ncbi:MAG: hypothetical protein ABJ360_22430 [Roseobacter sp.]
MSLILRPLLWAISALISVLTFLGFGLEWTAKRLVPLQKFLSRKIEATQ